MVEWHYKKGRKVSGGRIRTDRRCDKRLAWKGGPFLEAIASPQIEKDDIRVFKGMGGKKVKQKVRRAKTANVAERGKGKVTRAIIKSVFVNPANQHYTRRNVITKGCYIKVEIDGNEKIAKVTSKPGKDGAVNAILLTEKELKELEQKLREGKKKKPKIEQKENTSAVETEKKLEQKEEK